MVKLPLTVDAYMNMEVNNAGQLFLAAAAECTGEDYESTYALSIFERFFTLPPEFNHFSNSLS